MVEQSLSERGGGVPLSDLDSPRSVATLRLGAIFNAIPSLSHARLQEYVKFCGLLGVLALCLPALLIVSLLSLFVARVLGVPLFAPPSFPYHKR